MVYLSRPFETEPDIVPRGSSRFLGVGISEEMKIGNKSEDTYYKDRGLESPSLPKLLIAVSRKGTIGLEA